MVLPDSLQDMEETSHGTYSQTAMMLANTHDQYSQIKKCIGMQNRSLSMQATPSARPRSPKRSTGQYLPGLAPATEVRKRAAELRQQHLAKLKRLAGAQRNASSGAAEPTLGEHSVSVPMSRGHPH